MGDKPVARPIPTHKTTKTHNKRTQISIHRVGLEPMTPALQRAKTVNTSDSLATVIGTVKKCHEQRTMQIVK
jgi:hypothetical protein